MIEIFSRSKPFRGPLKGVIMGWSGTAVDYGGFGSIQAVIDAFRESWIEIGPGEVRQCLGLSYADLLLAVLQSEPVSSSWLDIYGAPPTEYDLDRLCRTVEQLMPGYAADHAKPVPGLLEAVSEFQGRGLRVGMTSSHTYGAMDALAEAARERGFQPDSMVCSSDVPGGRPYPWMCFQNAINLEAYPVESLVKISDAVPGVQEGLNAGMWTIGVLKTSSRIGMTEEEIARADAVDLQQRLDLLEGDFFEANAHFVVDGIWSCPEIVDRINERLAQGERP